MKRHVKIDVREEREREIRGRESSWYCREGCGEMGELETVPLGLLLCLSACPRMCLTRSGG